MEALHIILGCLSALISLFLLLLLIYLLFLIRPRRRTPEKELLCDYAHRGLHGNGIPENSLAAFELACKAGYGIELDVQLSCDKTVMVFHDEALTRMTGVEKKLKELDRAELQSLSLAGSDQTIPTLSEVLALVNGRVPLLIELKGEDTNAELCPHLASLLEGYTGAYCLESFNPLLIGKMKEHLPQALRGLLYTDVCKEKKNKSLLNRALTAMALNFLAKPHFIAYHQGYRASLPVRLTTRLWHAPRFVWTVRTEEELAAARENGECPIFEFITPKK